VKTYTCLGDGKLEKRNRGVSSTACGLMVWIVLLHYFDAISLYVSLLFAALHAPACERRGGWSAAEHSRRQRDAGEFARGLFTAAAQQFHAAISTNAS